jgi:hypothetical protein
MPSATPSTRWPSVIDRFTEKVGLTQFALYVFDYGAPVGFRLADEASAAGDGDHFAERQRVRRGVERRVEPDPCVLARPFGGQPRRAARVSDLPETTKWQYTHGVPDGSAISPDGIRAR